MTADDDLQASIDRAFAARVATGACVDVVQVRAFHRKDHAGEYVLIRFECIDDTSFSVPFPIPENLFETLH